IQSNGVTLISETLSLGGFIIRGNSSLSGGTLACSNVTYSGIGANFVQAGGSFIVTNTLSFGGEAAPFSDIRPSFAFENGTLTASNIEILATLIINSSGTPGRISNPGFFKLGG